MSIYIYICKSVYTYMLTCTHTPQKKQRCEATPRGLVDAAVTEVVTGAADVQLQQLGAAATVDSSEDEDAGAVAEE